MKIRIIAVAIGLSLTAFVARANDVLQVAETGENFFDIHATLNGTPVAVMLTGAADNWTIQFPTGYALNVTASSIFVGEPEDPADTNEIDVTQPTFMLWQSDISGSIAPAGTNFQQNPVTITNAGTDPAGNQVDLVLSDGPATVPDTSSTVILLGISLVGLAFFARMRRAAV